MKEPKARPPARRAAATMAREAEPAGPGAEAPEVAVTPTARPRAAGGRKAISSNPARNIGTIIGKELLSYFASPIAYLVITAFLVMNGYLYSIILFSSRQASLSSEFSDMAIILLFLSPAITMRLLSEEQRQGTIELLLTSPIRDSELVLGKWLAAMVFFLVMLALTVTFPLFLIRFGSPDVGTMLSGYLGVLLLEGVFLAIGLLMSSLTQNQIVA
ncbi:MAG: ABC transporter permease subunit, partial [Chloroflexota bacterium]|nr:ABC transporter permease subunit [Chloroflexota bacterium]